MKRATIFMSYFAILIVLLLTSIPFSVSQSNVVDSIDQICKKTPYYDLCCSVLHSNPAITPKTDLKGIAIVLVNNTIVANTSATLKYTEGLIKNTTDETLMRALDFCAETYIPLVKYILPQAADAISQGRFAYANYSISVSEKEVDKCNKKFSGSMQSPLADRNSILLKLLDVAYAIIQNLKPLKG